MSSAHVADRLIHAIGRKRSPVCVGIDPVIERLPKEFRPTDDSALSSAQAIKEYCQALIAAVEPYVPCIKFQSACFERHGHEGVRVLRELIGSSATDLLQVVLDAKRGDIGITAEHYAAAAFHGDASADWLTVNAYLGDDGIRPFLQVGHGAFALVRTSNAGGDAIQNLRLGDGRTVAQAVAALISEIGAQHLGELGYSSLGAVVGATKPEDAKLLRQLMRQQLFLVPGYGAQGAGIDDVLPCFASDGNGALITASRSVIYAFKPDDSQWHQAVKEAAAQFAEEIGRAVGMR